MSVAGVDALLADRYRLDERLAVGGTGEVWRATDTVLQRAVVVTTRTPEQTDDPECRVRLFAEVRRVAGLSHPGIAPVLDVGELPEGAWLVTEPPDGEPLSAVVHRDGPLSPDRVLDLVAQTAHALAVAHAGSVVHRDLGLHDLLVRRDGTVTVTGFGMAPATGAGPEVDLQALGVIAVACLTGALPLPGPDQLTVAHTQALAALPDDVPGPVVELLARLLAEDVGAGRASAAALADEATALRRALPPETSADPAEVAEIDSSEKSFTPAHLPSHQESSTTVLLPASDRPRPGATSTDQRRVVNGISVLLALLVLVFSLRAVLADDAVEVPAVPPGAGAQETVAALRAVDLDALREQTSSATVPAGAVVELRPAPGSEVDAGSTVTVVVSTGPAPDPVRDEDDR